ncbi:MAG TPA: SdrD B-like domain-containing protein [Gemmataceae bacterium]|nr:SdrD B-like domain-containing protein [Gemmataceae bacterium]
MSRRKSIQRNRAILNVEALEDRALPSGNTISGFVYYDVNANGLFDPGEQPIANTSIALYNSSNVVVGTTTTDANGYYEFKLDQSTTPVDATLTKTVTFPSTQTNFNLSGLLDQFDPSLGDLQSVEIQHAGSITSEIKAENLSPDSVSHITGNVSGTLHLTAPGVDDNLTLTGTAGSFDAAKYDGTNDFSGASGTSFGQKTANGSNTIMVTDPAQVAAYVGTGQVTVSEEGDATSNATGGGNLEVNVHSTGESTITVIYHYKAHGPLQPGNYKIVETQPAGYTDGLESQQGTVIPGTIGTDFINVGLLQSDVPNNNFGELKTTSISGHVWFDANNDGVRDPGEALIPGTTVTLSGNGVNQTAVTDANGFYEFDNLQPGTYTVTETQPAGYLDGKDVAGTPGNGTVVEDPVHDQIQNITLTSGQASENNDFGEIKSSSLSGFVYYDANNDGNFDPSEKGIANVTVTLTGFDDNGPVSKTVKTDANGAYSFTNLRPGTYAITETQPSAYLDGKDTIGTPGGTTGNDVFSDIQLAAGVDGTNNNFGEIKADNPGNPLPKDVLPFGMLPHISKAQRTSIPSWQNIDPAFKAQMAFVVGSTITLTGQQLDQAGTLNAVQNLQTGGTGAFVTSLWNSNAHLQSLVKSTYNDILNRAPTSQELASAVADLKTGGSSLDLMESLYTSADFQALHPTSTGLATALYQSILNTTPGSATTQSLLQSLANDPLSTVVHDLLTTDAAVANQIDSAYMLVLRRHPTATEVQTWTPQIQAGTVTQDSLEQKLLKSQEFYQLASTHVV